MALLDNKLSFNTNWSTAQALTATADSTGIIDVTGAGSGNAPAMINGFPATNTAIGYDMGLGDGVAVPYLYLTITATGSSSNTLTIALKAAPDDGSYGQGTYTTIYTSKAFTESTLAVGNVLLVPVPPTIFKFNTVEALPRFYKLTYTASAAITVSVLAGIILNPPSSWIAGQYPSNFLVV